MAATQPISELLGAKPLLGYWALRGLGEPIRSLHAYLGVELEERAYGKPFMPKGNVTMAQKGADLAELGLALPNLPYYVDGGLKLTETAAILRYVCEKHSPGLLQVPGLPPLEGRALHDQVFTFLLCANNAVRAYQYGYLPQTRSREGKAKGGPTGSLAFKDIWTAEKDAEMAEWAIEQISEALGAGEQAKATSGISGPLLFGPTPTAADFFLFEHTHLVQCMAPEVANLEWLRPYREAFEALPGISSYFASEHRIDVPFNAPFVRFGGCMDQAAPYAVKPSQ